MKWEHKKLQNFVKICIEIGKRKGKLKGIDRRISRTLERKLRFNIIMCYYCLGFEWFWPFGKKEKLMFKNNKFYEYTFWEKWRC